MRRLVFFILIAAVIGTLYATNPREEEYIEWVINQSRPGSGHSLSRMICPETAPMYLDDATERRNFLLFSVFHTGTASGDTATALGVCNQFILIRGYGATKD